MKASDFYKRVTKTSNATQSTQVNEASTTTAETVIVEAENIEKQTSLKKDDNYYFDILDPKTGMRYNIPLLEKTGSYYQDYVHYMKIKETSPSTFDKIMSWN